MQKKFKKLILALAFFMLIGVGITFTSKTAEAATTYKVYYMNSDKAVKIGNYYFKMVYEDSGQIVKMSTSVNSKIKMYI